MKYPFDINIEASSEAEASLVMNAMNELQKAARTQMTTKDFIEFSDKVKKKPSLIIGARLYVLKR